MEGIFDELKEKICNISFKLQSIKKDNDEAKKEVVVKFNDVKEDDDFLNVIEDFYLVESLSKLGFEGEDRGMQQRISNIKKVANYHGNLLRLAFFYFSELEKCINEVNNIDLKRYYLDLPCFDQSSFEGVCSVLSRCNMLGVNKYCHYSFIDDMFEYLIEKSTDDDYVIERLYVLNMVYSIITYNCEPNFRKLCNRILNVHSRIGIIEECISQLPILIDSVKKWFDEAIKETENNLLCLITNKDLNQVGKFDGINHFGKKNPKSTKRE